MLWKGLQPSRRLLLFDTCQAGEEVDGASRGLESASDVYEPGEQVANVGSGIWIVASSTQAGAAQETAANGVFTSALLEGLAGAADNKQNGGNENGIIDIEELIDYAERTVRDQEGAQRVTRPSVQSGVPFPLATVPGGR